MAAFSDTGGGMCVSWPETISVKGDLPEFIRSGVYSLFFPATPSSSIATGKDTCIHVHHDVLQLHM